LVALDWIVNAAAGVAIADSAAKATNCPKARKRAARLL
jgi:hypothetical protein